jgi:hypothetical protein
MALKFRKVDDAIDQPERRKSYEHYFNDAPMPGYTPLHLPASSGHSGTTSKKDSVLPAAAPRPAPSPTTTVTATLLPKPAAKPTHTTKHPFSLYFLRT